MRIAETNSFWMNIGPWIIVQQVTSNPMKAISLSMTGLLLMAVFRSSSIQAQATANELVTVTTNAPTAVATPAAPASTFVLQPLGIMKELDKLVRSGTDPGVIKAFIQGWRTPYSVSADDILHLHDLGLPSDVLTLLVQHQADLAGQGQSVSMPAQMPAASGAPIPYPGATAPVPMPTTPAPPVPDPYAAGASYPVEVPVQTYPDYSTYDYGYYGYPGPYYDIPGRTIIPILQGSSSWEGSAFMGTRAIMEIMERLVDTAGMPDWEAILADLADMAPLEADTAAVLVGTAEAVVGKAAGTDRRA
jgi:hypothetical protein